VSTIESSSAYRSVSGAALMRSSPEVQLCAVGAAVGWIAAAPRILAVGAGLDEAGDQTRRLRMGPRKSRTGITTQQCWRMRTIPRHRSFPKRSGMGL